MFQVGGVDVDDDLDRLDPLEADFARRRFDAFDPPTGMAAGESTIQVRQAAAAGPQTPAPRAPPARTPQRLASASTR
ncbi:hypothetical protein [Embleya sp. NPDC020630]|uniref:hypothetical protein n=1 Tax=Embleya sp. NPDC020630 TaxID=3363979 RepID=UPI00378BB554